MTITIISPAPETAMFTMALQPFFPDEKIIYWNGVDPITDEILETTYVAAYKHPHGCLTPLSKLKLVCSMEAGIDHFIGDKQFPNVPLSKMVRADLSQRIKEYVTEQVLIQHRREWLLRNQQANKQWVQQAQPLAPNRTVGFLGFGQLAQDSVAPLMALGFNIRAWKKSPMDFDGVDVFVGDNQREAFLSKTDILVNLLPLTNETQGILNKDLFDKLPKEAAVINVGRGAHMVEEDLLPAIQSGQLSGVSMDVQSVEPMPEDHPLWDIAAQSENRIWITPHMGGQPDDFAGLIENVVRRIKTHMVTGEIIDEVDKTKGY